MPFCMKKCGYCDFYSVCGSTAQQRTDYIHSVIKHMEMSQDKTLFCDSLYLGGGTPSLLAPQDVEMLINAAARCFDLSEKSEITLEMNPCTADREKLSGFVASGVNRISLGVQSLDDRELSALGRLHDSMGAREALDMIFEAGFDNVSCDVMFGIPYQTRESLEYTLRQLCRYPVSHISAYGLKIEPSTPFYTQKLSLCDEDTERQMYFDIAQILSEYGFEQYEISNFARDGRASRHNMKYWLGEEYLAFGPCASGYLHGERYTYARSLEEYASAIGEGRNPPESERYTVDDDERAQESIIFGLRTKYGISLEKCGIDAKKITESPFFKRLSAENMILLSEDNLRLTPRGYYVSNSIINEVLELVGY